MSSSNPVNLYGLDSRYATPTQVAAKAPLQEQLLHVGNAGATQSVSSPLSAPYATIVHYTLSANLTLTLPVVSSGGGESFSVWVDQPSGGSYTLTFSGSVRWIGGSAAIAPGASQRMWCTFLGDNSTTQWIGMIVSGGF